MNHQLGELPISVVGGFACRSGLKCYAGYGIPLQIAGMTTKLTLDKAGRVVIPKPLRV